MTVNNTPLVSVVISALNAEKYIGTAIDSILAQTYTNFELIIINDGSTDNTEDIILSYKDRRIRLVKNETNLGLAKSLNKGIKLADGKYIARLDADDIAAKDRFEVQIKYLEYKPEIAVCGSYYRAFSEDNSTIIRQPLISEQIKIRLFFENPMGHPTVMMRNQIFKKDNYSYNESFRTAQDYDLWCRISHKYDITNLPFVLTDYRIHSSQVSSTPLEQLRADRVILIRQAEYLLKRKLTKKEQFTHFQLMKRTKGLNSPHLNHTKVIEWIKLLLEANNRNNVYDQEAFKREMSRWFQITDTSDKMLISLNSEEIEREFIRKRFLKIYKRNMNFDSPQTWNEKIQVLKFSYKRNKKEVTKLTDKYLVREYVKNIVGEKYLNKLYAVYDKVDNIDFDRLPDKFVIKLNHGSGYNIICKDKVNLDLSTIKTKLKRWYEQNYYYLGYEWNYKNIRPLIIIERLLEDSTKDILIDYKFHVFNGRPLYIQVDVDRFLNQKRCFYNTKWKKQPFTLGYPYYEGKIEEPNNLDEMIDIAKKLAAHYESVRIDLYNIAGKIYFGEITFFPGNGFESFYPYKHDFIWGNKLQI
jgi:glycosyltransferase involved in cell wall biosynthesis